MTANMPKLAFFGDWIELDLDDCRICLIDNDVFYFCKDDLNGYFCMNGKMVIILQAYQFPSCWMVVFCANEWMEYKSKIDRIMPPVYYHAVEWSAGIAISFLCEWIDGISNPIPFHFSSTGFSFISLLWQNRDIPHLNKTMKQLFFFVSTKQNTESSLEFHYTFPSPFNVTTRTKQKINTSISHLGHQH